MILRRCAYWAYNNFCVSKTLHCKKSNRLSPRYLDLLFSITKILLLDWKDYNNVANAIDISDKDNAVAFLIHGMLKGMYMLQIAIQ
jgi:hypothetical protein